MSMVRKKSLANFLLLTLEKSVDGYVRLEDFLYNPGFYISGDRHLKKSTLSQVIKRLRIKGLVETEFNQDKVIIKLSSLGKDFVYSRALEESKWDGKWRMVIFDIPESKRKLRSILRYRLKIWGFKQWQKSVWVTKKNLTEKLKVLIKELDLEQWVIIAETSNVNRKH